MHRLAHGVVAPEGEGDVAEAAAGGGVGQFLLDAPHRLEEGEGVFVMLFDACSHRENVGVEDDILGREADLFGEQFVGALADGEFVVGRFRLPLLVESHHNDGRAIAAHQLGLLQKLGLPFFEAYRIDDALALHTAQTRLNHLPFGGI